MWIEKLNKLYIIFIPFTDVAECISDADCDENEVCMDGDCEGNYNSVTMILHVVCILITHLEIC